MLPRPRTWMILAAREGRFDVVPEEFREQLREQFKGEDKLITKRFEKPLYGVSKDTHEELIKDLKDE